MCDEIACQYVKNHVISYFDRVSLGSESYLQYVLYDLFIAAARLQQPSWLNYDGSSLHGNSTFQNKTQRWLCLSLTPSPTPNKLPTARTTTAASHSASTLQYCAIFFSLIPFSLILPLMSLYLQ